MSTDQNGANGRFEHVRRFNIRLSKKDWCVYKGECIEDLNINGNLCYHCKHKKLLDIPKIISEVIK